MVDGSSISTFRSPSRYGTKFKRRNRKDEREREMARWANRLKSRKGPRLHTHLQKISIAGVGFQVPPLRGMPRQRAVAARF